MDNFNVPPCDPGWDYATQWELLHGMKHRIEELIKQMATHEQSTNEMNKTICEENELITSTGIACINLTGFHPSALDEK